MSVVAGVGVGGGVLSVVGRGVLVAKGAGGDGVWKFVKAGGSGVAGAGGVVLL